MLDVTARSCTTASGVVVSCVGVSRIAGVPGVVVVVIVVAAARVVDVARILVPGVVVGVRIVVVRVVVSIARIIIIRLVLVIRTAGGNILNRFGSLSRSRFGLLLSGGLRSGGRSRGGSRFRRRRGSSSRGRWGWR